MALKREDVEKTVQWTGDWRVVFVKSKEDHMKVRNGTPTSAFWDLWKVSKAEIKELGISVRKEENEEGTSEWKISYWADVTEEEKEKAQTEWQEKMAAREQNEELNDSDYE